LQNDLTVMSGEVPPWVVAGVLRSAAMSTPDTRTRDAAATNYGSLAQPDLSENSRESLILPFK
jgi:hypothetical protein